MRPTYVLVPGAGGDTFYWHLVAQSMGAISAPLACDGLSSPRSCSFADELAPGGDGRCPSPSRDALLAGPEPRQADKPF